MKIKLQKGLFIGTYPLSQLFGENPKAYAPYGLYGHNGIDYALPSGTKLISCIKGTITETEWDKNGYGKYIKIENDECGVLYAHMKSMSHLEVDDKVNPGDFLGESGNTGNSTGPHLHFGVFPKPRDRSNGYAGYVDPLSDGVEWVNSLDSAENKDLKKEIKELKGKLEVAKVLCQEWEEAVNTANETIFNLNKERDEDKQKRYELAQEIKRLEEEIERLKELPENRKYTVQESLAYLIEALGKWLEKKLQRIAPKGPKTS